MILVAVSLDPHNVQEAAIEIPLWEWGLPDHASLAATDLMRGHRFVWTGKQQRIRLDPADLPFAIWQIAPLGAAMMDIAAARSEPGPPSAERGGRCGTRTRSSTSCTSSRSSTPTTTASAISPA